MFISLLKLLGGIAIFLYGLKVISKGTESLIVGVKTQSFSKFVKNPLLGAMTGSVVAGITQSSVAVSFITVGMVDAGVISFDLSAPIIMGANVGTTITAQLVSLSGGSGVIIGAIASIIGLLAGFCKNNKIKTFGETAMGLGLIFAGLQIMDGCIIGLVDYGWFEWLFLIENPFVLFLNGLILTSVVQSSSAITSVTVILAYKGLVDFNNAVYVTLGSNVGSCFSVILASKDKSLQAKRASMFNLVFNFLGATVFFPILLLFEDEISYFFTKGGISTGRAIANFHTIFNLACAIMFIPISKILTRFISRIIPDQTKTTVKRKIKKIFTYKSNNFY